MTENKRKEIPPILQKEELISWATKIEKACYYPDGRYVDGAIYTSLKEGVTEFISAAELFMGSGNLRAGHVYIVGKIDDRKQKGENKADRDCGNWELWTILNELDVSRERG